MAGKMSGETFLDNDGVAGYWVRRTCELVVRAVT